MTSATVTEGFVQDVAVSSAKMVITCQVHTVMNVHHDARNAQDLQLVLNALVADTDLNANILVTLCVRSVLVRRNVRNVFLGDTDRFVSFTVR